MMLAALAETSITIDGVFITAFFAGIAVVISALVAAYLKIRNWQQENREAQETAVAAQVANVKAVDKVHKLVNSRDTAQRKLIKELYAAISDAGGLAPNGGGTKVVKKAIRKPVKKTPRRKR